MAFSLLRWGKSGRCWSRGEPPPRGSVEYCGVPEVFQPPPRPSSPAVELASPSDVASAGREIDELARQVARSRRERGSQVVSDARAARFTEFYKRWRTVAGSPGGVSRTTLAALATEARSYEDVARRRATSTPASAPETLAGADPTANPPKTGGGSGVLWLLGAAGAAYLGSRWLDSRDGREEAPPDDDSGDPGGSVVVLEPGDVVVSGRDVGDGEEYDVCESDEENKNVP